MVGMTGSTTLRALSFQMAEYWVGLRVELRAVMMAQSLRKALHWAG